MTRLKVLVVVGTRPEAIKLAPVILELRRHPVFRLRLVVTAQHRELLDAMLADFGLRPDEDLDLMRPGQSLNAFFALALEKLHLLFKRERPDLVVAQGDTATVHAAALTAFQRKTPFAHVEAGLRSHDKWLPWPEEKIRVLTDHLSDILLAPTRQAKQNLLKENIPASSIFVTGNTGIDALLRAAKSPHRFRDPFLRGLDPAARLAVVTLHRRESFGKPLRSIFRGLMRAARRCPQLTWIYPVHPNPLVYNAAHRLLRHRRIHLLPPLSYPDFVALMKRCEFIVTDSGGIQEEAPSLGKPVLVMRDKTERRKALGRGSLLVGASGESLLHALPKVLSKKIKPSGGNPFGDGKAARRVAAALLYWAGRGRRPKDF